MSSEETIPVQYTHPIKIEDTAKGISVKGIRIDVHVYANSYVNRSVRMYGCIPDMYYV